MVRDEQVIDQQRQVAVALRRLQSLERQRCFTADDLQSRPTPKQDQILRDIEHYKIRAVTSGNQCLAVGTEVLTPTGIVPIEQLRPGDQVYSEHGTPINVLRVFYRGMQPVVDLCNRRQVLATATMNHVWQCTPSRLLTTAELPRCRGVRRVEVDAPLGVVDEPDAYVIGALLGDGCSRQDSKNYTYVSTADAEVVHAVARHLGGDVKPPPEGQYTWRIGAALQSPLYDAWIKGKYAHEKTADLDVIRTWNRRSALAFMAGLLDTDGCVSINPTRSKYCMAISMQARPVIDAALYLMKALWQVTPTVRIDNRDKYINGPVYTVQISNIEAITRALRQMSPWLRCERRQYRPEYEQLASSRTTVHRRGIKLDNPHQKPCWDIHVDSPTNLYLLANGLVTHNSGKSQLAMRELSWLLERTHPYYNMPDKPLLVLMLGRVGEQIETSLWRKKLRPLLAGGSYREVRAGNMLQRIEFDNGNIIIPISHHNVNEAREKAQSYVADYVILDEMPNSLGLISELAMRVQAQPHARMLMTFTPLIRNAAITKYIDNLDPAIGKKYQMNMLDNPIYAGRAEEIMAQLKDLPEQERRTRLYGDWYAGDLAVYRLSMDTHVQNPPDYNFSWRHVEAIDPAASGKAGWLLLAEHPATGVWYVVMEEYLMGAAASDLLPAIQNLIGPRNVVLRVSDPHEVWFIKEAAKRGLHYTGVYRKHERKSELIKAVQSCLNEGKLHIASWCVKLIDELNTCTWSDSKDNKIVGSSRFHLLDSLQYAIDNLPAYTSLQPSLTWEQQLRASHHARLKRIAQAGKGRIRARIDPRRGVRR